MKIGILTYHRSHNYGALLQAIATRVILEKMGHNVYYVDYWPGYHKRRYAMINPRIVFSGHIHSALTYLNNLRQTYKTKCLRRKAMFLFIKNYIEPYCKPLSDDYDIIIYGSDQIWRKQPELKNYNPIYFGKNKIKTKKHVAYAASMETLPTSLKDKSYLKMLISNLDSISVREEKLKQLLNSLGFSNVKKTLDPTLLLTSQEWNALIPCSNYCGARYALFYDFQINTFSEDEINKFVKSKGLILKVIYGYAVKDESDNDICSVSADVFLNLIRNADFVFTSSFHGLAFAILYGKPFYASFLRNSERAKSLLTTLGLNDYLLQPQEKIPNNLEKINYELIFSKLEILRKDSIQFLESSCNAKLQIENTFQRK